MDQDIATIQALADPTRLRLLNLLTQTGEICVCELVDALDMPQYNVSRHLNVLARAGWVDDRRQGKWIYYRMAHGLRSWQRSLLHSLGQLREERADFRQDEARAGRRLQLRRDGMCCVGIISKIGKALAPAHTAPEAGLPPAPNEIMEESS